MTKSDTKKLKELKKMIQELSDLRKINDKLQSKLNKIELKKQRKVGN